MIFYQKLSEFSRLKSRCEKNWVLPKLTLFVEMLLLKISIDLIWEMLWFLWGFSKIAIRNNVTVDPNVNGHDGHDNGRPSSNFQISLFSEISREKWRLCHVMLRKWRHRRLIKRRRHNLAPSLDCGLVPDLLTAIYSIRGAALGGLSFPAVLCSLPTWLRQE